jgi:hypothetical protein
MYILGLYFLSVIGNMFYIRPYYLEKLNEWYVCVYNITRTNHQQQKPTQNEPNTTTYAAFGIISHAAFGIISHAAFGISR